MGEFKIKIFFDGTKTQNNIKNIKKIFEKAVEESVEKAASVLLRDCRPYVPMLTGALRDSAHKEKLTQELHNYAFKLIWDAANPLSGYVYAARQYSEVLQHVDGRYAAKWVENAVRKNPERYSFLCARFLRIALSRVLQRSIDLPESGT
jgi:hypothetical protein